jgi:hypothetical protein
MDHTLIRAACTAVKQGAAVDAARMLELLRALEVDATNVDREGWASFVAFLELAPARTPAYYFSVLARYPEDLRLVGLAAAGERAKDEGLISDEELDALQLPLLARGKPQQLTSRLPRSSDPLDLLSEPKTGDVVEAAALRLLSRHDDVAPQVVQLFDHVSIGAWGRLESALIAAGHGDLVKEQTRSTMKSMAQVAKWAAEYDADGPANFLAHLSSTPAAELNDVQAGDLGELADLYGRLGLHSLGGWPRKSDDQAWWFAFIDLIVRLGGFNPSVLSAQAQLLQRRVELFGKGAFYALEINSNVRALDSWAGLSTEELGAAMVVLRRGLFSGVDTAHTAAAALAKAPRELAEPLLIQAAGELEGHRRHQRWVVIALAMVQQEANLEHWASTASAVFRLVAASEIEPGDGSGSPNSVLAQLAFDDDREVAKMAVERLADASPTALAPGALGQLLERVVNTTRSDWTCTHCSTQNRDSASSCHNCHIVPPDPKKAAREALEALGAQLK